MEIWLKQNKDAMQIPILPPSIPITVANGHQTINIQTKGDVSILGETGLKGFTLSSFFPAQDYPFAAYPKDREPMEYVKKIENWMKEPIRVTVTETNINMETTVQSFSYDEPDGSGDIEYTLELQEYRKPTYTKPKKKLPTVSDINNDKKDPPKKRPTKTPPRTHIVKSGDCLWNIAKKYYGSGSKESKIYNANKDVIEKAARKHGYSSSYHRGEPGWWIFPGTKLVIPK